MITRHPDQAAGAREIRLHAPHAMCHDSKVDQMSVRGISDEALKSGVRDSLSEGSLLTIGVGYSSSLAW